MNRENIQKVRDVIAGLPPERFDMRYLFGRDGKDTHRAQDNPRAFLKECGTAACIAGWTVAALKPRAKGADAADAAELLGLGYEQDDALFLPDGFDEGVRYTQAHAVRVLDHLLATGEVDWKSTRRAKKADTSDRQGKVPGMDQSGASS